MRKKGYICISVYLYIMIRGFTKNSSRMQMSVRLLLFLVLRAVKPCFTLFCGL